MEIDVLSRLQGLPNNGRWVDSREWFTQDEAFNAIAEGLHAVVQAMTDERSSPPGLDPDIGSAELALRVYFSYAPQDFDSFQQLYKYLRPVEAQDIIQIRHARSYNHNWGLERHAPLEWADLIVLLLSPDFLANEHCLREVIPQALARRDRGTAELTLVLIQDCFWRLTSLADCLVLPRDGSAVLGSGAAEARFSDVATQFLSLVDALLPDQ